MFALCTRTCGQKGKKNLIVFSTAGLRAEPRQNFKPLSCFLFLKSMLNSVEQITNHLGLF